MAASNLQTSHGTDRTQPKFSLEGFGIRAQLLAALCILASLHFPALLKGQAVAREAFASFPADTQQAAYTNLAELRALPDYSQIQRRLFTRQLRDFQDFLRSMDTDPDKDVDEVMLGWRGERLDASGFFGIAAGRFQPDRAHQFFAQHQLPFSEYAGTELYAFGTGAAPTDLFFCFLTSSAAAFGRLSDVKAMLEVRAGTRPALDSMADFIAWEAELEGTAPQWGIATGQAARNQAGPWLTGQGKLSTDLSTLLKPLKAALYRVQWHDGFSPHLTIICESAETAAALAEVLALVRDSRQATAANTKPGLASLLGGLDVHAEGPRVELSGSGPREALEQIFRTFASPRDQ